MKKLFQLSALALLPASTQLHAQYTTNDAVDEEIYTIDNFVADAPNTIPGFDEEKGNNINITFNSLSMFETLAARGDLLEYIELLDAEGNTAISLNDDGSVTMTVNQVS